MIRITNGPVERIVPEDALQKWVMEGYRLVDPLPASAVVNPVKPVQEPEPEWVEQQDAIEIPDDLEKRKLKELRELADKIGVQGYQNMDKNTLIAVIRNH